ncbi:NUDIX domain-containing protein [Nonomuraea aridisoli]|uniref:NUDIX domain-containing protein n=1 Tax=Nonomuraea aridisoli TaxID=2070368 RepID=UPI001F16DBFD|nr:NUDIX domain-containing protein [Nonomuraea aridisoli]
MTDPTTTPFARVKIRTGALVFCGDDIALIRRDRPTGSHYTPPGGNVATGEDLLDALWRELDEELVLHHGDAPPARVVLDPGSDGHAARPDAAAA